MKALLAGATGATGLQVLTQLLNDPDFQEVHIFVRKTVEIKHQKLHIHTVNFNQPAQWKHLVKGDVAFSCMGTTLKTAGSKEAQYKVDVDYQFSFADAAKENGVARFIIVSAYGANSSSALFYSKMKGILEDKIRKLHFHRLTIFQPGMLKRDQSDRFGEVAGTKVLSFLNMMGLFKKQKPLPTETLAKAMLNAAKITSPGVSIIKLSDIFLYADKLQSEKS